jgi:hypothetical protein
MKKETIDLSKIFVPFDVADKMLSLGYKEPCLATIDQTGYIHIKGTKYPIRGAMWYQEINVPTYEQALDWFEKKYKLRFSIIPTQFGQFWIKMTDSQKYGDKFDTYTEARLHCVKQIINVVEKLYENI